MPDHVHMLLAIPPKYSVSSVMGYLKGKALEDGDKRLAASYAHLEEAERIARSGRLISTLMPPANGVATSSPASVITEMDSFITYAP